MKKPYLPLLALAGIFSGIIASCSSKDNDTKPYSNPLIIGHWQYIVGLDTTFDKQHLVVSTDTVDTKGRDNIYIDFQSDGKFQTNQGDSAAGTYRFTDTQTLEVTNSEGQSSELPILTLTNQQLTFVTTDTDYVSGNYKKEYLYFKK
jgi:hypothetical protein